MVHSIGIGTFTAHHIQLTCPCPEHQTVWSCEDLGHIVPAGGNFAYDAIVEIGSLRFQQHRQVQEVQTIFQERYAVEISASEVELLIEKFVLYLSTIHQNSTDLIREHIQSRGGYLLHLDCTCEGDSPKLASSIDELSGFVLYSAKIRSENADELVSFLRKIEALFGRPLAVLSDLSKGNVAAVKTVFGAIRHLLCHYHFLLNAGKHLLEAEKIVLFKKLAKAGISGQLKKIRGSLEKRNEIQSVSQVEQYLAAPKEQSAQLRAYCLILWVLDHASEGDGYGFPFDHSYLQFYLRIEQAYEFLDEIVLSHPGSGQFLFRLWNLFRDICQDQKLKQTVELYVQKRKLFQQLRQALRLTEVETTHGLTETGMVASEAEMKSTQKQVNSCCQSLTKQDNKDDDDNMSKSCRELKEYIEKYKPMLFCDPLEVMIDGQKQLIYPHRTNNIMERHFRGIHYGYRRIQGNSSIKKHLDTMPEALPIVTNLKNKEYIEIVFGKEQDIAKKFAEIDVEIIRKKHAEKKIAKIHCSKRIKKIIREPEFLKRLKEASGTQITKI